MGRHNAPEEPRPPRDKPRYRFAVAISGIVVLAFISMAIVAAVFPESGPQAVAGPDGNGAANPFPQVPAGPEPVGPEPTSPQPMGPEPTGPQPTGPQPPTQPNTEPIAGAYRLTQEWGTGFIGAVRLTNDTGQAASWQVRLDFPSTVGGLVNHWIAGGPGGATHTRVGQTSVFDSQAPLAAGATIELQFQFDKEGTSFSPTGCTVNGRACS